MSDTEESSVIWDNTDITEIGNSNIVDQNGLLEGSIGCELYDYGKIVRSSFIHCILIWVIFPKISFIKGVHGYFKLRNTAIWKTGQANSCPF